MIFDASKERLARCRLEEASPVVSELEVDPEILLVGIDDMFT